MEFGFENLADSKLIVDAIYKGGATSDFGAEPLHHIFPKCGISGGFRKVRRVDDSTKMAYVVLYTTLNEPEWPDSIDNSTGVFKYYGDNRTAGRALTDTNAGGNRLLENVFSILNSNGPYDDIPPFFIFRNVGIGRDMQFLGVAAPGTCCMSPEHELIALWKTINGSRFQNYEAYFTVLDTGEEPITRTWLEKLINDHASSIAYAPAAWRSFINSGRNGIVPLIRQK